MRLSRCTGVPRRRSTPVPIPRYIDYPTASSDRCVMECRQERTVMEDELSRTVDALPGLVWTAFPDGRTEFVNRRWCEYTGLSVEQASGEGWLAAFHPDDRPALLESWRGTIASLE